MNTKITTEGSTLLRRAYGGQAREASNLKLQTSKGISRLAGLALLVGILASCVPAPAATVVSTNAAGQMIITSDLTNMTQLLAEIKGEVTANAPASAGSFASTALSYFSSFNVSLDPTFATMKGYALAGVDSIQGGPTTLANSLLIDYGVASLFGSTNAAGIGRHLAFESLTRNSGVAGTIVSQSAGLAMNFQIHDVDLALFAHGGYNFAETDSSKAKMYGEVGARVMKALSEHTFAGVGVSATLPRKEQVFTAFAGFTF